MFESYSRVFLSDEYGNVIHDLGGLLPRGLDSIPADSLVQLVEYKRLQAFLEAVRTREDSPDSEMRVQAAGSAGSLLFRGFRTPYGVLIVVNVAGESEPLAADPLNDDTADLTKAVHDITNQLSSIFSSCDYLTAYGQENLDREQLEVVSQIEAAARLALERTAILVRPRPGLRPPEPSTADLERTQNQALATQKLKSVGVLASGIAHDFNNMLGAVIAESDAALSEIPADTPAGAALQRINVVAQRAAEIVRQLLIYTGQEGASSGAVDLSAVVNEMLNLLKVVISKTSVLKTDLAGNLPPVLASAAQLRQIVMNLVTNASDSLPETGGVITVRTGLAVGEIRGVPKTDHDCLRLEVRDTGRGMSKGVQSRIFDPGFTTKQAGHGLGLSVVLGIVRSLGGAIDVVSAPGEGTTVEVLLPAANEPLSSGDSVTAIPPGSDVAIAGVVLVIEDEESLRIPVAKMLRKEGFSVLEVGDGGEALDVLRAHESVRLVVLDLTLPGLSGNKVLAEVRRTRPGVQVILTSAYDARTAVNAVGGQQDAFIRKPYRLADLLEIIREKLRD